MANRIMLNETSYHGAGAIQEIANEAKARAFKKAFVCSDPDLLMKFILILKQTRPSRMCSMAFRHLKMQKQIILLQSVEDHPWIQPRQLVSLLQIRNLKM